MDEAQVQPDVTSHNSIINACAQSGDVNRAEQWFKWMELVEIQPNIVSYSGVIKACAQNSDVKGAQQWFK